MSQTQFYILKREFRQREGIMAALLDEINKCHSVGGANAYVRDVLSRCHRTIREQEAEIDRLRAGNIELADICERCLSDIAKLRAALEEISKKDTHLAPDGMEWVGPCRIIADRALAKEQKDQT